MFISIPGFCLLDANNIPTAVTTKSVSRHCQVSPRRQNHPAYKPPIQMQCPVSLNLVLSMPFYSKAVVIGFRGLPTYIILHMYFSWLMVDTYFQADDHGDYNFF